MSLQLLEKTGKSFRLGLIYDEAAKRNDDLPEPAMQGPELAIRSRDYGQHPGLS